MQCAAEGESWEQNMIKNVSEEHFVKTTDCNAEVSLDLVGGEVGTSVCKILRNRKAVVHSSR